MPIALHLCLHALFGLLLAWATRKNPQAQTRLFAWPLLAGLLYDAAFVLPSISWHARFYPAHALSYGFDPLLQPGAYAWPSGMPLLAACAALGCLSLAYAGGRALLRLGRPLLLLLPASLSLLGIAATTGLMYERTFYLGDYTAYWQGRATPWTSHVHAWWTLSIYFVALLLLRIIQRRYADRDPHSLAFFC